MFIFCCYRFPHQMIITTSSNNNRTASKMRITVYWNIRFNSISLGWYRYQITRRSSSFQKPLPFQTGKYCMLYSVIKWMAYSHFNRPYFLVKPIKESVCKDIRYFQNGQMKWYLWEYLDVYISLMTGRKKRRKRCCLFWLWFKKFQIFTPCNGGVV